MDEKKYPRCQDGDDRAIYIFKYGTLLKMIHPLFPLATLLILFFCHERFEEHQGSCSSLGASNALKNVNHLQSLLITISTGWEYACRSINRLNRNFERSRNGDQCGGLWLTLSVEKLIDHRPVKIG
jgi:hypothetical protein